ncbi:quinone oxidoreductase family protein [Deinococcus alpinitundrae]|uniref:quinone oxidoreductase family protein n=1 Tax=Deinococcus alpinitundrae TaxID=468913 RepID=UPI001ED924A8|nr:NADPH:quinone oxidoreductase family protein [Deinococcus alpinitundrae]
MTQAQTMRQILVEQTGNPDVMQLRDATRPEPRAGQVRLKVQAAGINFADVLAVKGQYLTPTKLPLIPGGEFAGTIDALGEGVTGFEIGQQVAALTGQGALQEYAIVPLRGIIPVPDGLDAAEAAAFPVSYYTAYITLVTLGRAQKGETVLVQGAAGALGTALIQVATALELNIIAIASTDAKLKLAEGLGAHTTLNSEREDLVDAVKEATGGNGVHILVEITGGEMVAKSLKMLANMGRLMIVGAASGEQASINPAALMKKNLSVTGVWLTPMLGDQNMVRDALAFFNPLVAAGKLRPQVGPRYPLAESAQAFQDILDRKTTGKVTIEPQK